MALGPNDQHIISKKEVLVRRNEVEKNVDIKVQLLQARLSDGESIINDIRKKELNKFM